MKAIETCWNGWRFRSRTEARWAVLFNQLNIKFEYEKEGYELPSGRYLPDFWLPYHPTVLPHRLPATGEWIEIKGEAPSLHELDLAWELATEGDFLVNILCGAPSYCDNIWIKIYPSSNILRPFGQISTVSSYSHQRGYFLHFLSQFMLNNEGPYYKDYMKIIENVRGARFEFGEVPVVR